VPALLISSGSPLSDLSRFRELTPQLVTGQTVGAGHFITLFVPEQVNAMIERFLVISLPPGVSPPDRDSAKPALVTDQEVWEARSSAEPDTAGEPIWEPFRRAPAHRSLFRVTALRWCDTGCCDWAVTGPR
jgi:hypothetical protein